MLPVLTGTSSMDLHRELSPDPTSSFHPRVVTLTLQPMHSSRFMERLLAVLESDSFEHSTSSDDDHSAPPVFTPSPEFERFARLLNGWPVAFEFLLSALREVARARLPKLRATQLQTVWAALCEQVPLCVHFFVSLAINTYFCMFLHDHFVCLSEGA